MFELILLLVVGFVIFVCGAGILFVASVIMGVINFIVRLAFALLRIAGLLIALPIRLIWGVTNSDVKVRKARGARP